MILRNLTPFVPLTFESHDQRGRDFGVFFLRGAFSIVPDAPLQPLAEQPSFIKSDDYFGEAFHSSVRIESDLVPYKPRADIIINAVAHAPGGRPARGWLVRARVGKVKKRLLVTGKRFWSHSLIRGWHLSEPEPCVEVPLRYELAYGGIWSHNGTDDMFEQNPIGVGYVISRDLKRDQVIPAPQIDLPTDPIIDIGKTYTPQGLGIIGRAWLSRRKFAGTYDEKWKVERCPELPADFDFAYYNGAHPDLIYPGYLVGDEQVILEGLHPGGTLHFSLPAYQLSFVLEHEDASQTSVPLNLDTLLIDVPENLAHLTWRARFDLERPVCALHASLRY